MSAKRSKEQKLQRDSKKNNIQTWHKKEQKPNTTIKRTIAKTGSKRTKSENGIKENRQARHRNEQKPSTTPKNKKTNMT